MLLSYLLRWSAILLLGLLIYGQTFHFDFVFDDHIFIVGNPYIKSFSHMHAMWHSFPLTRLIGMCSFALNYVINQLHPQGYHIFNVMVHFVAVGLVWALANKLLKIVKWLPSKDWFIREMPFILAVLFLVHPCQTQAVSYISQRFESMATVFYLGAIYSYLSARTSSAGPRQMALFGLTGLLTLLGVMTKEVVATVPFMLLALEWIFFTQKDPKKFYIVLAVGGVVLYFVFSKMVHTGLRIFLDTFPSESHDGDVLTPLRYLMTQMRVFLTFLRLMVLPIHQNLEYDYPASTGLLAPPLTLVGMGVIATMIWAVVQLRRRLPLMAFGMAWMLITFSINLAPRSNVIFEHKLYLISFGFFLTVMVGLSLIIRNRGTLVRILLCVVVVLSWASFQRNKVWANELALWEDSIKKSPNKARVNASLGRIYGNLGRYDEAIQYLTRSIVLNPDNIAYVNRGVIYSLQGHMEQALQDLNKAIAMDPNYFSAYVKRAWIYKTQNHYDAAFADLAQAIQLDPMFLDGYIERGMILREIGRTEEALQDFQQALIIAPYDYSALINRGALYYALGQYDLALEDFKKAKVVEPTSTQAVQNQALCLVKLGRQQEAQALLGPK